jgi:hypothetical protein
MCLSWAFADNAAANAPIKSYSAIPSSTQAGGHPDLEVAFSVENRVLQKSQSPCNCEDAKDANIHLPAGFIGNPHATPQCTVAQFSADECPIDSQVGIANVLATNGIGFDTAVYNIVPPPEDAGLLGFKIFLFDTPQFTILGARTGGDYGLDSDTTSIFHGLFPLEALQEVLWGVPAAPSHDRLRINPRNSLGGPSFPGSLCDSSGQLATSDPESVDEFCIGNFVGFTPLHSNALSAPFLQNPTTCDTTLSSTLEVLSYDSGLTSAHYPWPKLTGCDQLSFNPSLYAQPTTSTTDSPSGMDVDLTVPQQVSPTVPSPTELRRATVTLPQGFSINPNAADGKTACQDTDASFGTTFAANCPDSAKIGSLTIDSSALPGPLPGFVYLGEPLPGNRYRIFLVADGFGTHIKLPGVVTPDPSTGQLTITLNELPQSPLTAFNMHIFGSERGLLATPAQCGTYAVTSTFEPWDSSLSAQSSTQFFTLAAGPNGKHCPGATRPFEPGFEAASLNHSPGAHAPFSLEVTRSDGDQGLAGLTVSTPPGLSATIAGVRYCSDAALAAAAASSYSGITEQQSPSCPPGALIGTSVAGAGAGTHPVYLPGKVYLAGPYKGAPLSLAAITPAVSGPYDLGDVVVRAALHVDPTDTHITAVSDPLPQIVGGIPIRLRSLRIGLDRPNFTLNPTNCSPFAIGATLSGDQGARAELSRHFQMANCATLPYGPQLSLKLSGGLNRRGHPAIHAFFTAEPGESNTRDVSVTLPPGELLDNSHLGNVCTRPAFEAERCPPSSMIGTAEASTPLLENPLEGKVYLRSNPNRGLPDVVADLKGQIDVELAGQVSSSKSGGLRTTFRAVPDAPVSSFRLNLLGGSKGLLQNSSSLCGSPRKAIVKMAGQNGVVSSAAPRLQVACGSKGRHKRANNSGRNAK